jgi:hypothetical protein
MVYNPRPEPDTEATRKRKANVGVGPAGKWVKIARKK